MSGKRTATSDLNHDNWDDDAEPEEAGTFSQASQDELKGRVIKKAKRRIAANTDAAPSVFAGFGGFKSTAAPASGNLFGFLSKPDATSVAPAAAGESAPAAKSPLAANGKAASTGFAGFQGFSNGNSGKWECSSCMVFNTNDKDACACCSTPRPGAAAKASTAPGFSFGVKATSPASKESAPASGFAGFSGFNSNNAGKWTCSDCMVQNKDDVDTCPCCGATKPGAVPKKAAPAAATPASGFSFGYKPETTAAPSLATGTFAFGKPSESSSGGATGFTFGVKADASAPPTGFSFGAKPEATTTPASTFSFGAKSEGASTASSSPAVGFSFGVAKSSTPQQTSSPSLEKPAEAKSTSGKDSASTVSKGNSTEFCRRLKALNQQVSEWIKLHVDKDPLVILSPIFKDYEKHLHELESKYGGSAESASGSGIDRVAEIGKSDNKTEHKNSKPDETASSGFTFGSKSATPTTPAFSFGSAAKPSVEKPASEAAGGFSFGSGSQSTDSSKAGLFSFGSDSKAPKSTFSFGDSSAQKPASAAPFVFGDSAKASPATGFSFGAPGTSTPSFAFTPASSTAPSEENTQDADQEEDEEPPKVEVNSVVEEDAIHSVKCKLFYKKEKEFKDKGVGMLHLKRVDGSKTQMVVRAETNLGNILLNILINSQMSFTKRTNNVQFVCVPNPPIANMEGPVPMLVRVKTADMADELIKKLEEAAAA